ARAVRRSWDCLFKNWIVSFAPLAYGVGLSLVAFLVAPLGIIGGLLIGLATQACLSSGLFLIKNIVESGRADFNDFLNGFMVYLWELVRIAFILWIPTMVARAVLGSFPNGALIYLLIQIAAYILLNPVPEFIYQTRSSGIELLSDGYNFIVENWLEWLAPNILMTIAGYVIVNWLALLTAGLPGFLQLFAIPVGFGLCLVYFMVFRGFLFAELHGTSRRSRLYRYKAQR
ncbi:MAG: hypothetical protein ACREQO_18385, partial [Candidatus Binatia bacterium]